MTFDAGHGSCCGDFQARDLQARSPAVSLHESLSLHLPLRIVQRLVGTGSSFAQDKILSAEKEPPSHRFMQVEIFPLLMSLVGVGLVTAPLLFLDHTVAALSLIHI